MNIVIIEDEQLVARDLQKLIREIDPELKILTTLGSLKSCVEYFKSNPEPDLLFMDVQLSDGVSFDLFNEVAIKSPIIFTTAYDEYAIRAFKLNSIDYLLKPIDRNELKMAIDKFKRQQNADGFDFKEQFQRLMKHVSEPQQEKMFKERFLAHSGKTYTIVNSSDIGYFIKDTLIYIITKDKNKLVTDFQTMEEAEEFLNPDKFFRANRQMIIQADIVESFRADAYGKLVAKLKSPIEYYRRYQQGAGPGLQEMAGIVCSNNTSQPFFSALRLAFTGLRWV